jgi:two-component system NtrC family sensor kinase
MLEQVQRQTPCDGGKPIQGRRFDRMELIGRMTSGIAHDLNNVLMVVSGNVDLLRHEPKSEKSDRLLDTIQRMAQRGKCLTEQLLSFATSRLSQPSVIDIGVVVQELSGMFRHCLRCDIRLKIDVSDEPCLVEIDRGEFELAALNLAVNARDAMPNGGSFIMSVTPQRPQQEIAAGNRRGEFVALRFSDTGTGIPARLLSRVFEPFFTTKEMGKGTGLGLSQVYEFARQSGGHVTISSLQKAGTTVTIHLPRAHNASHEIKERHERPLPERAKPR